MPIYSLGFGGLRFRVFRVVVQKACARNSLDAGSLFCYDLRKCSHNGWRHRTML